MRDGLAFFIARSDSLSMKIATELPSILKHWRNKKGFTQSELAGYLGVKQNTISSWEKGVRTPGMDELDKLCEIYKVSFVSFLMKQDSELPAFSPVPLLAARPRGGIGGHETEEDIQSWYSFHTDFLLRKGCPEKMRLFFIAGDSMSPTLNEGDMVMVDTSQTLPVVSGKIYMLRIGDELMMKRLENRPNSILWLQSDNSRYSPIEINTHEENDVEIFGRMVWSCREY